MPELPAHIARFTFEASKLAPETFEVISFTGVEQISQPYRFEIELLSTDPKVAFSDIVNQPAQLIMKRELDLPVTINGTVIDFEQAGRIKDRVIYRAVLAPRLWLLSLNHQSRVFQNLTVDEILSQVLEEAGFAPADFKFALTGSYAPREYCVQYRETDLNFLNRLLEFEGIHYFFEQSDDGEVLVMTDDRAENPKITGKTEIEYHTGAGLASEEGQEETVNAFISRERIVTGKVVLKDYNYLTPNTKLLSESQINTDMPGVHYDYGQHFKDLSEGDRLARVRNEEIEAGRRVMTGDSTGLHFRVGHVFSLVEHYREDLNLDYLFTHVHHFGSQRQVLGLSLEEDESPIYRNEFTCIPATVPFRPPRITPEPKIPGIMTARVESAGGEYAFIDDQGRYKLKMPFDLGDLTDGKASLPVRMAQPYSGSGYGLHFPNHADTEMVWACIDGHVDRPVGLSTVPNPSQATPVTSDNKTINMIKTESNNVISMDDTHGTEHFLISTPWDNTITCGNDQVIEVGNNQASTVGVDQSLEVGSNQTIDVGADRSKTIGANQTESVAVDKTITVGGSHTETVGADMTQSVGASKSESVAMNKSVTIGIMYDVSIGAAMNERIGAAKMEEIGGAKAVTVGGMSSEDVGVNKSLSAGGNISESAGKDKSLDVGKDFKTSVGGKHSETVAKEYELKAKKIILNADDEIVIQTGQAKITMKKNGEIKISGNKVEVAGKQDVKLKGMKVTTEASAKNLTKGAMVNAEASGIMTIKGSLVKIN